MLFHLSHSFFFILCLFLRLKLINSFECWLSLWYSALKKSPEKREKLTKEKIKKRNHDKYCAYHSKQNKLIMLLQILVSHRVELSELEEKKNDARKRKKKMKSKKNVANSWYIWGFHVYVWNRFPSFWIWRVSALLTTYTIFFSFSLSSSS